MSYNLWEKIVEGPEVKRKFLNRESLKFQFGLSLTKFISQKNLNLS